MPGAISATPSRWPLEVDVWPLHYQRYQIQVHLHIPKIKIQQPSLPVSSIYSLNSYSETFRTEKAESEKYITRTSNTLSISAIVLDALRDASQFVPCLLLRTAASTALSIVQQAQVCSY
jgi:hypothetical protein